MQIPAFLAWWILFSQYQRLYIIYNHFIFFSYTHYDHSLTEYLLIIILSQFNKKASSETKEALEKLKADGATQIVLDLRGNPGGLLNEAVNICNLFVPKGEIIVTTKSKNEKLLN